MAFSLYPLSLWPFSFPTLRPFLEAPEFPAFCSWERDLLPVLEPIVSAQPHKHKYYDDRYAESRKTET